jgi:L-threonylcarbamoyladenylate synthase
VDPKRPKAADVRWAAAVLLNGGVLAIPTDTVYGLACDCRNPSAIRRLYALKGREPKKPLACLTAYKEQILALSDSVPEELWKAAKKHWPGALTLVAPKGPWLPEELTSGLPSIGVRYPNCPWVWELIEAVGFPIAASSANRSGDPAAVLGSRVLKDWAGKADMVVDGGACVIGRESTVAGLKAGRLEVFRQGALQL